MVLQGAFVKIGNFIKFKGFLGIPREQAILRKAKTPRKSPEKRTFLSLAFTMHLVCTLLKRSRNRHSLLMFHFVMYSISMTTCGACLFRTKRGVETMLLVQAECAAVAAIRLRMRMRLLTRPENSLANFGHQILRKKLRITRCESIR